MTTMPSTADSITARQRASLARSRSSSCDARRQIVQHAGEFPFAADRHLAHRQMQRETSCHRGGGR